MCDGIFILLLYHWLYTRLTLRLPIEEHQLLSFEFQFQGSDACGRVAAIKAGNHMQGIGAPGVAAQPGHHQCPNIPPRTLVDRLVDIDVLGFLLAVARTIRRQAHPLGRTTTKDLHLPAVFREADLHHLPELGVLVFVVLMQVVHIKPTDVAQDFLGALVAPVPF